MEWNNEAVILLCFCLAALIIGISVDQVLAKLHPGTTYHTAAVSALAAAVLFIIHGAGILAFQRWCACQILLYASAHDMTDRIVPNHVHLLLLFVGLLHIPHPGSSIAGLLLPPLPFLIVAWMVPGKVGGADIKLMAALGFLLGVRAGVGAAVVGLLMAVIFQAAYGKRRPFALVPYLSIGAFLAFLT